MELRGLNDRQLEAVKATEGRVRIIAGAGSGKTRVLAYRYAYLVDVLGIDPGNILCLTFTNKAAQEMRSRINRLIGGEHASDFICTIHSFCVKFLREEIFRLGYPKTFQILDEEDMKTIAKEAHEENGIDRKESTVERFLKKFYKIKVRSDPDYISGFLLPDAKCQLNSEVKRYISKNCEEKTEELFVSTILRQRKYLSLDFEDLIYFTLYIRQNFPDVKAKWQRKMNYVLVDEVQDCNTKDWEIYETLSALHGNLFLVGAPDQTIYEWRGAHLEKFVNWQPTTDVIMAQNYRSTATILDAANSIIDNNGLRIKKDLFTSNEKGEKITHYHGKDDRQEADWMSNKILDMKDTGAGFEDFAVLVRSSYLTRAIEQSFMRNKISYVIWGGVRFFERKEIKDALSYLRLIAFDDDLSFKRIVNVPSRKVGSKSKHHVKVMTIHQSKGLEFPYVFIAGLSDGIMPNKRSVRERKKSGMEEERRLMYVAATRAEKKLFLTESEGNSAQGGFNKVPSRFIREIKEGLLVTEGHMDEDLWNRAALFSRSMDAECGLAVIERKGFTEGDEVIHEHFGNGIIRNIYDGGEYCEVEFFDSGTRSLKADKLKKA